MIMAGTSVGLQTLTGIQGQRAAPAFSDVVEQGFLDPTNPPILYGVPVKNVSGKFAKILSGDTASLIVGWLTLPSIDDLPSVLNQALGATTPNPARAHGILRKGDLFVQVLGPTAPVAWGTVYVRVADTGATGRAFGGIEAAVGAGSDCVAITGVTFVGGRDANNIAQIRIG